MFLFFVIKVTIKSLDIKLNKKTCVFMMFIVMICFGIYVVEMINTKRVYTWDQCCYYNNQIDLLNGFNQSFIKGIGKIIKTTYNSDYGYFLLSFTTLIFSFTSKTEKAFILTYAVVEILPVIFVLLLNIINIGQKFNIKNKKIFIISSSIVILTFPLLHRAALWGQPDIFGLFWIGLIVLITTNYKFENIDIRKWTLIILFSFLLAITRRWYIFWMIGYYTSYGVFLLIESAMLDKNVFIKKLKNIIIFAVIAVILLIILLAPIIYRTIKANYAVNYSAWNKGGLIYEVKQQKLFLGYFFIILMIIGIIYGLYKKEIRFFILTNFIALLLTSLLFSRIQNSWYHQSLIYVTQYILLISIGIGIVGKINNKYICYILEILIITGLVLSAYGSVTESKIFFNNKFYGNVSLKPEYREDYESIGEMVSFIKENCEINKDRVYPNFATNKYCGHTLSQFLMPDNYLQSIMIYESSIDSVHGFPIEILTAKYIIIANQILDGTSAATKSKTIPNINNALLNIEEIKNKFKKVREFDMKNGVIFIVYERNEEVDKKESEIWKKLVEEESLKYPNLFGERIDSFIKEICND